MFKSVRIFCAVLLAVLVAICLTCALVFAEELPVALPSPEEASVSSRVDVASNEDASMGTKFFMYIPPDIVANDYPQMGDSGMSTQQLLKIAIMSGVAYLVAVAYLWADVKICEKKRLCAF